MDIFAAFATDETKEEEGVVVFLSKQKADGPGDRATDPWIQVARVNNTAYASAMLESYNNIQAKKKGGMSEEQVQILSRNGMIEVLAKTILKDFGNLTFQGKALKADETGKLQVLRVKDFREKVFEIASDVENYRVQAAEQISGN